MNVGMYGGYNLPLHDFLKVENEKLERAFNFAKEEKERVEGN